MERAKDIALSQSMAGSYNNETGFDMGSSVSSPSSTIHGGSIYPEGFSISDRAGRNHLTKSQASLGGEELNDKAVMKKSHRFSKRQSKNGLSTPFWAAIMSVHNLQYSAQKFETSWIEHIFPFPLLSIGSAALVSLFGFTSCIPFIPPYDRALTNYQDPCVLSFLWGSTLRFGLTSTWIGIFWGRGFGRVRPSNNPLHFAYIMFDFWLHYREREHCSFLG